MLDLAWPRDDFSRVQYRLYHDSSIYEQEHERIFRGPTWSLLCLEAEIPTAAILSPPTWARYRSS
jgi:anthranilate 1,2-dioxygenase large subunit